MTLLEKRVRGLEKDLAAAISKLHHGLAPKNVHRLRTTIRRIESFISYSHPNLDKKTERSLKKLAELRKRAGKVRDFDVQLGLLHGLANGSAAKDRESLATLLKKKRERQGKRLSAEIEKLNDSRLFTRLNKLAGQSEQPEFQFADAKPLLPPLEEAKAQLAEMANDFSAQESLKPGRLHKARIRLKGIRYMAELAEESPEQEKLLNELKVVQDSIGEWHDWEELVRAAEKNFSNRSNCALLCEVRALFAARHSAACSAIQQLFSQAQHQDKKPSNSVQSIRSIARSA